MSNKITHEVDLSKLPDGVTYEDKYGGYLKVFEEIANIDVDINVTVNNPPWSWVPLLTYLNCNVISPRLKFKHCSFVRSIFRENNIDRTSLEVLCGFRPETVDALYQIDTGVWSQKRVMTYPKEKEFIITTNGGFFRQEVRDYLDALQDYIPPKKNVLLVPCAADKPYPAPLHREVLEIMPDSFYLATLTGALGLVPQELWDKMPWYDAGIPNQWRMQNIIYQYFLHKPHKWIVVYCDYQTQAVHNGLWMLGALHDTIFVNDVDEFEDTSIQIYVDLMDPQRLSKLKQALELRS